jgi:hypothetical protein
MLGGYGAGHGSDHVLVGTPEYQNPKVTGELVTRAEGDSFVIRGQKSAWVSNGTFATHAALYVSLESARSMGMAGRMRVRPHGDGTR